MGYRYILTRVSKPGELSKPDYKWTEDVVIWSTSIEDIKKQLITMYPSTYDQWEYVKSEAQGASEDYLWGQIPDGARFEFTIHSKPFLWLSIETSYTEEVIKIAKFLGLSVLDQSGEWTYIQGT